MPLNASGPISIGGSTTGQSINLELGLSATAATSLNDAAVRTLAGVASGVISLSNFYGKSSVPLDLGTTWTYQNVTSSSAWGYETIQDIVWNGAQFLIVGGSSSNAGVSTSPDGITWTKRTGFPSASWAGFLVTAEWGAFKFLAAGGGGRLATSDDGGVTWTFRTGLSSTSWGSTYVNDINWNGSQFLAIGDSGRAATSTDGITWTYQSGLSSTSWGAGEARSMVWAGDAFNLFIVVGSNGGVATSPDGITWTYQSGLSATAWGTKQAECVEYSSTLAKLCAGGAFGGTLATSTS